jgi:PAS domain S-box-containing protein
MDGILKILFIEDVLQDAELIWREIKKDGLQFSHELVSTQQDYLDALNHSSPDIIISDFNLPGFDGLTALSLRNKICPLTPFILVTGSVNEEIAVECMKSGADDYILKENLVRLLPAINNSIQKIKLTRERKNARDDLFRSERRLQKAQAIAHIGNWELDLSTKIVWCSDEAMNLYGLDKSTHEFSYEELKKSPLPEYRNMLDDTMNRLLKYNEQYEAEFEIKRISDGAIRYIYSKAELVKEPESDQVKVIGVIQDITDRKHSEEALAFNNLLLKTQQESSIDGILVVDGNNIILNSNKRFFSIWGIPGDIVKSGSDEAIFKYMTDKSVDREKFVRNDKGVFNSNEEIAHDEVELKDGRTLDCYSSPMFGPDKKFYGRVWYFRDITNRKWAEDTIRESEKKYRNIFENVQDLYYETTLDGTILDISPSIGIFSNGLYTSSDLMSTSIYDLYDDQSRRELLLSLLREVGNVTDFESGFKNRDGSLIPCSVSSKIVNDSEGKPEKIIGSVRNISERKKAEEAIMQERRMLRTLIDNIPDPIYVQDEKCRKVIANRADIENIGLSNEEEALGKTDLELFPGEIGERGYKADKMVIDSGKPVFNLEEEFVAKNGKKRWLLTTKIPLFDRMGKVTGLVGIGHDNTARKENEIELIRAKEKAEESDKLKTAFLHNISHEIRTPMNAIVGFSALLGEPDVDDLSRKSYIDLIMQSSNHLLSIITDIVDISNIEANLIKTVKNEINLNQTIKSLCNQFFPKAYEKKITLDCETSLPDSEVLVLSDKTKLIQIISNLISNSIKFTDKGNVRVLYRLKGKFLEISVADTGIGIPEQYRDRVFDRFFQVQSNISRLYEGTGLGLAISKAYVGLLGGEIWVTSEPGRGTTFSFTIPYERIVVPTIATAERKAPDSFVFNEKRVILVAEDIESNFKLIRYFLSNSNTEVIHAFNGKEAVEMCLRFENIDLILMDIKMPVMDGYTAVRLIREKNTSIPIIAQTAYADDRDRAIECGCTGFISKPFDKKGLFKVLTEFI